MSFSKWLLIKCGEGVVSLIILVVAIYMLAGAIYGIMAPFAWYVYLTGGVMTDEVYMGLWLTPSVIIWLFLLYDAAVTKYREDMKRKKYED